MNSATSLSDLRARRLAAGISQERIARGAECSYNTVRLAEKGFGSPAMLARIEKALADAIAAQTEGVNT
jgi:transcriptional regulator with XRE-family HTH domain